MDGEQRRLSRQPATALGCVRQEMPHEAVRQTGGLERCGTALVDGHRCWCYLCGSRHGWHSSRAGFTFLCSHARFCKAAAKCASTISTVSLALL